MNIGSTIRQKLSAFRWRPIGHILLIAFFGAIASAIFYKPAKTNGMYLREIIENHALEQTAARIVTQFKGSPETKDYTDNDWKRIEEGLSVCLVKSATEYSTSNDPYLNERATMDTPTNFANRFLKICGAI